MVTVVDVDGTRLPPNPGTGGDVTLAGVDVNLNNVRDDVERYIAENFRESARLRESLKSLMTDYGRAIAVRASAADSMALAQEILGHTNCAEASSPDGFSDAITATSHRFLNTLDRLRAFAQFEEHLGGEVFDSTGLTTGAAACSFDWLALPN